MKRCARCGTEKPQDADHFHRKRSKRGGFDPACKDCKNADKRAADVAYRKLGPAKDDPEENPSYHGPPCRCHSIPTMGHRFRQEDLRCAHSGCTQEWFKHQRKPLPCSHVPVPRPPRPSETQTVEIAI